MTLRELYRDPLTGRPAGSDMEVIVRRGEVAEHVNRVLGAAERAVAEVGALAGCVPLAADPHFGGAAARLRALQAAAVAAFDQVEAVVDVNALLEATGIPKYEGEPGVIGE